jgi:hypothetical protein
MGDFMLALRIGIFALLLPLAASLARAQSVDTQLWTGASASAEIAPRVSATLDSTQRFGDAANGLYQLTLGSFVGYQIGEGTEVAAGYQRVSDYAGGHVSRVEHRARQQLTLPLAGILGGSLTGRLRTEERFRETSGDVGLRVRGQVRFARPFRKGGPALVLTHESFVEVNDTDWGQASGYRRMRNAAALELPLSRELRLQGGYMNQYDFGTGGKRDAMANVITFSIGARF